MLRRISSAPTLRRTNTNSFTASSSRNFSESLDGPSSTTNNGKNVRAMCDTADGVYATMMASTTTSSAARTGSGGRRSPTASVFGDSPAAVGTSLLGCFFFATTYGYYIGGAVKEAAMNKMGAAADAE